MCECKLCYNKAAHFSRNTDLNLCDECYADFKDVYKISMEKDFGCSFDEYYEFESSSESNDLGK